MKVRLGKEYQSIPYLVLGSPKVTKEIKRRAEKMQAVNAS